MSRTDKAPKATTTATAPAITVPDNEPNASAGTTPVSDNDPQPSPDDAADAASEVGADPTSDPAEDVAKDPLMYFIVTGEVAVFKSIAKAEKHLNAPGAPTEYMVIRGRPAVAKKRTSLRG